MSNKDMQDGQGRTESGKSSIEPPHSIYTLLRPIDFEGEKITEIGYDLDRLDGAVICKTEQAFKTESSIATVFSPYASPMFLAELFARAADKPVELVRKLKAPDFAEVCATVQAFALGSGSES